MPVVSFLIVIVCDFVVTNVITNEKHVNGRMDGPDRNERTRPDGWGKMKYKFGDRQTTMDEWTTR